MAKRPIIAHKAALEAIEDEARESTGAATEKELDNSGGVEQAADRSEAEGELELKRSIAAKLGWKPKEQWDRDPANWRDAPDFLEDTPRQFEALRERNRALEERTKRNAQAAADAIEETRRRARQEAEEEIRRAAEAKDPDAAAKAAAKLAEATARPPAEAETWIAERPWVREDPAAGAVAAAAAEAVARRNGTTAEQLAAADEALKKRFPEYYEAERPQVRPEPRPEPKEEVRLSESRRAAAPAVASGSRGGSGAPKEKTFSDIPAADRAQYQRHFARNYEGAGLTTEQAQARYAKAYWKNLEPAR